MVVHISIMNMPIMQHAKAKVILNHMIRDVDFGYFFYQPYIDPTYFQIISTVSSQQDYQSQFYCVNSIDYGLQNLNQQFNSTQSSNAYSILIHEFNSTVYYHPLINSSNLTSLPDLEFQNITHHCQTYSQMQQCLQEKQILSDQLNQTVEFIKNGNYSIDERQNIDQLYQYWSRYGQKQVSIIFPVITYVKGINTQLPYSYSILLTGRVILDFRNQIKLFNILDVNIIKIPLITEFVVIGLIIIIFLTNYGVFVKFQIQDQIEILIQFLKTSLQHLWSNTKKEKKQGQQLQYCLQQVQIAQNTSQKIVNITNKSYDESNIEDYSKISSSPSNSNIYLKKNQEQQAFNLDQYYSQNGQLSGYKKSNHHTIHRSKFVQNGSFFQKAHTVLN
ncbi:tetratricopeptide repeat protein (macronuclear) [Tetrahymena thermophila SB210]|uniref:Tetratricopeptide repeat protein n=1 Tax=Tetrahymena thermophila (strain SB210) TaxID=312017 RepID=Q22XK9_TETTS|nr:tetratricopeptide repeat protein [Tetrahymena thermophila SB210]EAR90001.2 tetratricopeptide repeat protein [Tetrahymena thermophila SB210]|eukprot:XP_001010246.2 tetratricopeptide repeat protein [Tetrahymena thermophila SB210]